MKIGKRPARILLYEQVVEDLCLLIDRGDFEPGDQLPSERELIEKLNVSRNVLREAFHVLESRGVIVSHQGKGRFLRESPISGKEKRYDSLSKNLECYSMIEAYEVRQALEEKAVELIIKNASEKDIDELEEALQHLRKKYEETGRTSGEFELHRLYAAKTGSTFMTQTLEIVLNAIFDMMYVNFTDVLDATSAEAELESHGMIIQAIRERDVEKARKLMDEHLITSMNMFQ